MGAMNRRSIEASTNSRLAGLAKYGISTMQPMERHPTSKITIAREHILDEKETIT
jgi:hypothetical protein